MSRMAHLDAVFLLLIYHLPFSDMRFQALVKVDHADDRVSNGKDDEDDCDNRYYKVSACAACTKLNFYVTYQRSSNSSWRVCNLRHKGTGTS